MTVTIDQLPETRRAIVAALKMGGNATISQLAEKLHVSGEAVRQQLLQLLRDGWVEGLQQFAGPARAGRPAVSYRLTQAGDHLFPKHYDRLAVALIDAVAAELGPEALDRILSVVTEARLREWEPRLRDLTLEQRVEALRGIYLEPDAYMEAAHGADGYRLTERNCPFLNVALQRPRLCSVTLSVLARLLGFEVRREEKFQAGHGRCVFHVLASQPLAPDGPAFRAEDS